MRGCGVGFDRKTGEWRDNFRESRFCSFGVTEAIAAVLVSAGVGASTAAIVAPALLGAGTGALGSAVTGGDPLQGALTGGFTGGLAGPFGGEVGGALGIGVEGGDALIGAASGAVASGITGNDPLAGTLSGGVGGLFTGLQAGGDLNGIIGGGAATSPTVGAGGATVPGTGEVAGGGDFIGTATPTGAVPAITSTGVSPTNFGTSTPIGGTSAASTSLSAAGGGLPAGSIGGDLTSVSPLSGDISAAPTSNIAGGGGGGAGGGGGGVVPTPGGSTGILGTGITGGEVLEGGLLGYGLLSQRQQSGELTAPLTSSATSTAAQTDALNKQAAGLQPQIAALNQEASSLAAPLVSGAPLPTGAQQTIANTTQAKKAQVRSTYASLGLSGSSMEAQALAQVDSQAGSQTFDVQNALFQDSNTAFNQGNTVANQALQLIQAGQNGTQMNNALYESILNTQLQEDKQLQDSISNFASSIIGNPLAKAV